MEIHDPGNRQAFDVLYAFLSIDEKGNEGIVAHILPNVGSAPLVFGHARTAEIFEPFVKMICKETNKQVRLVKFTEKEVLKTYGG